MSKIQECVENLPEIYQRIYGHPEYDKFSRNCVERTEKILQVIRDYKRKTKKEHIKVMDIGCAQGYFSLSLQKDGCEVDGIDAEERNITCCKALAEEAELDCHFSKGYMNMEYVDGLPDGKYDAIILCSVIHHVARGKSFEYAREIVTKLSQKVNIMILELAVREEPIPEWNYALPTDFSEWMNKISFYDVLGYHQTHLSQVKRPMIFCSNRYVYCNNELYAFNKYLETSHVARIVDNRRKYYLGDSILAKCYRGCYPVEYDELRNEWAVIQQLRDHVTYLPEIIDLSEREDRLISIYRIHLGETLLYNLIKEKSSFDYNKVIYGVLNNLSEMESQGKYTSDLRTWNVCVDKAGDGFIIDFGSVSESIYDVIAENELPDMPMRITVYDSFIGLVFSIFNNEPNGLVSSFVGYTDHFPYEYKNFYKIFLATRKEDMKFKKLVEFFKIYILERKRLELSDIQRKYLDQRINERQKSVEAMYEKESHDRLVHIERKVEQTIVMNKEIKKYLIENNMNLLGNEIRDRAIHIERKVDHITNQEKEYRSYFEQIDRKIDCLNASVNAIQNLLPQKKILR